MLLRNSGIYGKCHTVTTSRRKVQRKSLWHMAMCCLCRENVPPPSRPMSPRSIAITLTCINLQQRAVRISTTVSVSQIRRQARSRRIIRHPLASLQNTVVLLNVKELEQKTKKSMEKIHNSIQHKNWNNKNYLRVPGRIDDSRFSGGGEYISETPIITSGLVVYSSGARFPKNHKLIINCYTYIITSSYSYDRK